MQERAIKSEYQHPDSSQLVRVPREAAHLICSKFGYRVRAIEGDDHVLEPLQGDVTNYPPVQVQMRQPPSLKNLGFKTFEE